MSIPEFCWPPAHDRLCGRPKRYKPFGPCVKIVNGYEAACPQHITEDEVQIAQLIARIVSVSRHGAVELGQRESLLRIEALEAEVDRLRELLRQDKATRVYWVKNAQIVEVHGFAYRWVNREPLKVGDRVWLPETATSRTQRGPGPFPGTVTAMGTTQRGELPLILRRDTRSGEHARSLNRSSAKIGPPPSQLSPNI